MNNLSLFFSAQIMSSFAFDMLSQSVAFYLFSATGSISGFATPFIIEYFAKSASSIFSGYVVDKFDRKRLYVGLDLFQVIYLSLVSVYIFFNGVNNNLLLIIPFFSSIVKAFTYPTNKAVVQSLKVKSGEKASSFEVSNDKVARTFSPIIAILFFARFGIKASIAVTAFMFLVSTMIKLFIDIERVELSKDKSTIKEYFLSGFKQLFKSKLLVLAWVNAAMAQFILHPFLKFTMPKLMRLNLVEENFPMWIRGLVSLLGGDYSDNYMSLIFVLSLANAIGALLSLLFFQYIDVRGEENRGMKLSVFYMFPVSLAMFFVIGYLGSYMNLSSTTLMYILFPINIAFYFGMNAYDVFFAIFYQKNVAKEHMGKFFGALLSIYMLTKAIGAIWYKRMLSSGIVAPVVVLLVTSIVRIFIYYSFEKESERSE